MGCAGGTCAGAGQPPCSAARDAVLALVCMGAVLRFRCLAVGAGCTRALAAALAELAPALVLGSRPVERRGLRQNEGFAWELQNGYQATHTKYYLPDEDRFWEASWYQRGDGDFSVFASHVVRDTLYVGFLICTELWFMQRARTYGKQGIHILANPRATERGTADKWLAGGRAAAAVVSGAFCLSSNRSASGTQPGDMGGLGWIVSPDGEVLGLTSVERPFVTVEIDLSAAERAKTTYPCYVLE